MAHAAVAPGTGHGDAVRPADQVPPSRAGTARQAQGRRRAPGKAPEDAGAAVPIIEVRDVDLVRGRAGLQPGRPAGDPRPGDLAERAPVVVLVIASGLSDSVHRLTRRW